MSLGRGCHDGLRTIVIFLCASYGSVHGQDEKMIELTEPGSAVEVSALHCAAPSLVSAGVGSLAVDPIR